MTDIAIAGKLDTLSDRISLVAAELQQLTLLVGCATLAALQGDAVRAEAATQTLADVMARVFANARQAEAQLAKLADVRRHTESTELGKVLRDAGAGGVPADVLAASLASFRAALELAKQLAAPWLAEAVERAKARQDQAEPKSAQAEPAKQGLVPITVSVFRGDKPIMPSTTFREPIIKIGRLRSSHICLSETEAPSGSGSVSGMHACIDIDGKWPPCVLNLCASPRTMLNGKTVERSEPLSEGDRLDIGPYTISIERIGE